MDTGGQLQARCEGSEPHHADAAPQGRLITGAELYIREASARLQRLAGM